MNLMEFLTNDSGLIVTPLRNTQCRCEQCVHVLTHSISNSFSLLLLYLRDSDDKTQFANDCSFICS